MLEEVLFVLQLIQVDFFTAFGLVTILYFISRIFFKNQIIEKVDDESNRFISVIGIVYLILWFLGIFVQGYNLNEAERALFLSRIFGNYNFGIWMQPVIWVVLTQLLRFKTIRKNVFLRIVFSMLFTISIERMSIVFASFQRDYLPSSWTVYSEIGIYPSNLFLSLFLKMIVFLVFVGLFYAVRNKFKRQKLQREES